MEYSILTGEELGVEFLPKVMDVDRACYVDEYVGELSQMVRRYERNQKTFVCVMEGGELAGYINFFPVKPKLWDEIVETGMEIRDDDIMPEEIADYSKTEENNLFIISVAIDPKYRKDRAVVKKLTEGFIAYLNHLEEEGYKIGAISATAVSEDGQKFLSSRMFRVYREIHDGNKVYLCEGDSLQKLLENDLYFKSYKDDVYLFLPYADNAKNKRINKLFGEEHSIENENIPDVAKYLLTALDDCLNYECQNDVVSELKRVYIGDFQFLVTNDEYPDEDVESRDLHIVGEERIYLSLLAHHSSHMYVVMLFIPNCRYSTSQIQDQLSQGYLKIREQNDRDELGFYQYTDMNDFLKMHYGLLPCGRGKSILCMSNKPEDEQEFYNLLTAEVYNSMHQNFHIGYDELKKQALDSRAIYNYYDSYMTEEVVAFILYNFNKGGVKARIELTATYIFIVEMVIFQNTALNKMTIKVSNALAHEGDVAYEYISGLYRDYAKTIKFWQSQNFKYYGTQKEADQIKQAFGNDELRKDYYEQQEFLEHIVELKNAQDEKRNGVVINIVATFLAIMEVHDYLLELLSNFYAHFKIPVEQASHTFDSGLLGGGGLLLLVLYILSKKNKYAKRKKLSEMIKKDEG